MAFPRSEAEMPEVSEEGQLRKLQELRRAKIVAVEVGFDAPHLTLTFDDGRVLFVNGWHEKSECWQLVLLCYKMLAFHFPI
jgi:hypothetical protein